MQLSEVAESEREAARERGYLLAGDDHEKRVNLSVSHDA